MVVVVVVVVVVLLFVKTVSTEKSGSVGHDWCVRYKQQPSWDCVWL
jgi:hypothetical protein